MAITLEKLNRLQAAYAKANNDYLRALSGGSSEGKLEQLRLAMINAQARYNQAFIDYQAQAQQATK